MENNLQAGLWIAQGPEMDILVNLTGKAPLLEFVCGIDLNAFKQGKIKPLSKESREIQDILMYPEKYVFDRPNTSEAINNKEGLGKLTFESISTNPERDKDVMNYYLKQLAMQDYNECKAKGINCEVAAINKTMIYIKNEYKLTLGQANNLITKLIKAYKKSFK